MPQKGKTAVVAEEKQPAKKKKQRPAPADSPVLKKGEIARFTRE